jgi:D-alanyl-lipoteichoic acid acyltransferase DltB (MBOAT superfamily)
VVRRSLAADGTKTPRSVNLVRAAVAVNLAFLGFFKYFHFFVDGVVSTADRIGLGLTTPAIQIALPIGISFFTFHAISYVIDVGRGEIEP